MDCVGAGVDAIDADVYPADFDLFVMGIKIIGALAGFDAGR